MTMKEIGAAEFKAQCLALLDEVDPEGIIITKRGKPVAKLVPMRDEPACARGPPTRQAASSAAIS